MLGVVNLLEHCLSKLSIKNLLDVFFIFSFRLEVMHGVGLVVELRQVLDTNGTWVMSILAIIEEPIILSIGLSIRPDRVIIAEPDHVPLLQ